jgi:Restriction endonuclease NotI
MPDHPLAEVFGFPIDNQSDQANRYRANRLCPFNNKVLNCTKDKVGDPLGVCTIFDKNELAVTCPVRMREDWLIAEDAAAFFFSAGTKWTPLPEVRLKDKNGKSAGNIDLVLVAYDSQGRVTDFGAVEIQTVYISGNVRTPFKCYMAAPAKGAKMDWRGMKNYPHADYLSSSRKRLAPQLLFKGGIIRGWKKKQAVVVHRAFWEKLPDLAPVGRDRAEVAWFIYDLRLNPKTNRYKLARHSTVYTLFQSALSAITVADPGPVDEFEDRLQRKLAAKLLHSGE